MEIDMLMKMMFYLIIYSFFGWVLESVFKSILQKKWVNSGFLHGPLCPIYGFGALIMILFLSQFENHIVLLFLASFFILSIWEYLVGEYLEVVYKTKYWDYSENKWNMNGKVCLQNSIYWGILGVIFTKCIHPAISTILDKIPMDIILYLNILAYVALIVDTIASTVKIKTMGKKLEELNQLKDRIADKLEELKDASKVLNVNTEAIQEKLKDLKYKQAKLKWKLYKQGKRLKNAFPTIQSEAITYILNYKIDLQERKQKIKKTKGE